MLTSLFHAGMFSLASVVLAMSGAAFAGIMIALIYKLHDDASGSYINILALTPVLICSVIMIVNGNLGTSVAVLGAFGLIRFRSAPGTAREIGYLFLAMACGLSAGMGFLSLMLLILVISCGMLLILEGIGFERHTSNYRQLRITIPEDLEYPGLFDDLFMEYTRSCSFIKARTVNMGTMFELTYQLELRDGRKEKQFLDELRCRNGNLGISLGIITRQKNEL